MHEKGGTGFPTLMFLDADGRKLMRHSSQRSTKAFEKSLAEVEDFRALQKRAEAGDPNAKTELFIRQLELEWFDYQEARSHAAELTKVTSKQSKTIEQLLVNTEVRSVAEKVGRDSEKLREAGAHFHAMWKEKRVPSAEAQLYPFWYMMAAYAEAEGDKRLFKQIVDEFKDALGSNSRYRRVLKSLEDRLEDFPRKTG